MTLPPDTFPYTIAPEPIIIVLSDGKQLTLPLETTRRIWEEVQAGRASSTEQFILRAFGLLDEQEILLAER